MAKRISVCDTGPLIALASVDGLHILPLLFPEVIIPSSVLVEATQDQQKPGASRIASAMRSPGFREYPGRLTGEFQALAELRDIGKAEALSIDQELGAIALIDEQRGRKVAVKRGIVITGTAVVFTTSGCEKSGS